MRMTAFPGWSGAGEDSATLRSSPSLPTYLHTEPGTVSACSSISRRHYTCYHRSPIPITSLDRVEASTMRKLRGVLLAALGLLVSGVPALAHHSFTAEFDGSKLLTHTGILE